MTISMRDMTNRAGVLSSAAEALQPAALQAARDAIAASCREYLSWSDLLSRRLERLPDEELHKFARALVLILLGHLPTRPGTCPFCIQYGRDRDCTGCGYAATHGRCDEDDSAFSLFIEAFQELGRAVYQDTEELGCPAEAARQILHSCLQSSCYASRQMELSLSSASALDLMELKARHIGDMVDLVPVQLLSQEVALKAQTVKKALLDYW